MAAALFRSPADLRAGNVDSGYKADSYIGYFYRCSTDAKGEGWTEGRAEMSRWRWGPGDWVERELNCVFFWRQMSDRVKFARARSRTNSRGRFLTLSRGTVTRFRMLRRHCESCRACFSAALQSRMPNPGHFWKSRCNCCHPNAYTDWTDRMKKSEMFGALPRN